MLLFNEKNDLNNPFQKICFVENSFLDFYSLNFKNFDKNIFMHEFILWTIENDFKNQSFITFALMCDVENIFEGMYDDSKSVFLKSLFDAVEKREFEAFSKEKELV